MNGLNGQFIPYFDPITQSFRYIWVPDQASFEAFYYNTNDSETTPDGCDEEDWTGKCADLDEFIAEWKNGKEAVS